MNSAWKDSLREIVRTTFSKIDSWYDFFEAPPRAANAKAFHVIALTGQAIMKTRLGPYIARFGRATYPFALAVVAPAVPRGVNQIVARTVTAPAFWFWFFVTMFFCLGLNAAFTCVAGTFAPSGSTLARLCPFESQPASSERLFFTQDVYNLFLYLLVVPGYVAFDITIIKLFVTTWPDFKRFADSIGSNGSTPDVADDLALTSTNKRIAAYFIVVTLIVVFFITGYINDILQPAGAVKREYWFVKTMSGGVRVLNEAGAYYLIMNATLLFLTVSALWCYIAISLEIARYAKNIGYAEVNKELSLKKDAHVLLFSQTLVFMKVLVALYAINIFIWSQSPLGAVDNAFIALIALLLVMTAFIPAPRIYLEYRWHALHSFTDDGYEDTRTTREKWTTRGLDWLVFLLLIFIAEQKFPNLFKWTYDTFTAPFKYLGNLVLKIFPAA